MKTFIGQNVYASFSYPARIDLSASPFQGMRMIRVDAVHGRLVDVEGGFAVFEADTIYPHPDDTGVPRGGDPNETGLTGYSFKCKLAHPVKYLGSIAPA